MKNLIFRTLGFVALMTGISAGASNSYGQLCHFLTGAEIREDFNTLPNSGTVNNGMDLPRGFGFNESGTSSTITFAADDGSNATVNTYSYGTSATTERALGELGGSTLNVVFGACFANQTGAPISEITVAYTGEQWRLGAARGGADRLDFQYSLDAGSVASGTWTDVNALDFSTPNLTGVGAKDGNAAANRTVLPKTKITLANSVPPGSVFWVRWASVTVTGANDGLSVDDFSLLPQNVPTAKTDFDGDGYSDFVIFRPTTGNWFILRSSDQTVQVALFGINGDIPLDGDFDGDNKSDFAIYRPSLGQWWFTRSSNNTVSATQFGTAGDRPVPGDYDKDGRTDIAFWRPSNGNYFVLRSSDNFSSFLAFPWGLSGDIPVGGADVP